MRWYVSAQIQNHELLDVGPEQRARLHQEITHQYRSPEEKEVMTRVKRYLMRGDNLLRVPLENGEVEMEQLIDAIKAKRCVPLADQDLGSTYLESAIGNAIHDLFPDQNVNDIRRIFNLEPQHH